jgi:hypothetical protein
MPGAAFGEWVASLFVSPPQSEQDALTEEQNARIQAAQLAVSEALQATVQQTYDEVVKYRTAINILRTQYDQLIDALVDSAGAVSDADKAMARAFWTGETGANAFKLRMWDDPFGMFLTDKPDWMWFEELVPEIYMGNMNSTWNGEAALTTAETAAADGPLTANPMPRSHAFGYSLYMAGNDGPRGSSAPSWRPPVVKYIEDPTGAIPSGLTADKNYPQLWVYWVQIALHQVRQLLIEVPFSSLGDIHPYPTSAATAGGHPAEDLFERLAATDMTQPAPALFGIWGLNHAAGKGILGTGSDTPEEVCQRLDPAAEPPYDYRAWTGWYANHVGIDAMYGTLSNQVSDNMWYLPGNAMCTIQGILKSGGGFQGSPEIGYNDVATRQNGLRGYKWTDFKETAYWGGLQTSQNGVWSLHANAKRISLAGPKLAAAGYTGWDNTLRAVGGAIERTAGRLEGHSDEILNIHKTFLKSVCEAKASIDDIGGIDESPFEAWIDRLAGEDDEYEADLAQQALDAQILDGADGTTVDAGLALFRHQCFLLSFVQNLSKYKRDFLERKYTDEDDPNHNSYKKVNKRLPYASVPDVSANESKKENACIMLDGDPYAFMNALTVNPDLRHLQNAMPHEISNIQPYIRLYKVEFDDEGNERDVEISFETHFSQHEMELFRNVKNRGVGAGLKSFNFTYDGSNPFAVKKSIKANLKIFANSFKELHRTRQDSAGSDYSYLDLAMKTWNTSGATASGPGGPDCYPAMDLFTENVINSELNFRLKAVVGLSHPNGSPNTISKKVRDALRESYVTLNLTPTVHNFEFDEMGRVTFNLNFLAYVEQFFDTNVFNVFSNADVTKKRLGREFNIKEHQRTCDREQIDIVKEEYAEEVHGEIGTALSTLFDQLIINDLIYSINIPNDFLTEFLMRGPYGDYDDAFGFFLFGIHAPNSGAFNMSGVTPSRNSATQNGVLQSSLDSAMTTASGAYSDDQIAADGVDADTVRNQIAAALFTGTPDFTQIEYFYLSDLIDTILDNIGSELNELGADGGLDDLIGQGAIQCEDVKAKASVYKKSSQSFKRMRFLLGPVEFANPNYDESNPHVVVNLGDIPISVKYFAEWLTNVMFKKDEVFYPLSRFMNDLINGLVRDFLNDSSCFGYNIKQKARLQQATVSGFSPEFQTALGETEQYDVITGRLLTLGDRAKYYTEEVQMRGSGRITAYATAGTAARAALAEAAANPGDEELATEAARLSAVYEAMDPDPPPRPRSNAFRAHLDDFPLVDEAGNRSRPILNTSGPPGSPRNSAPLDQLYNYMVYFVGRVMPNERMVGDKDMDENAGIFHYTLGRDRGTLKNIKLTKTQTKGLAEVRFEQDGYDGLSQLRVIYDAQIDMFSNVQAYPGQYVFIDPRGFAPDMPLGLAKDEFGLTKLGVGGYYMIVRSEHEFGPGYANSILHTKWVNQIDSEADDNEDNLTLGSSGDGSAIPRRCQLPTPPAPEEGDEDPSL